MEGRIVSKLVSFAGLIATVLVAYGCERWVTRLRSEMGETLGIERYLWPDSFALMILATALMLLTWYVVIRSKRDYWVAGAFIVVGLAATFAVAIEISLRSRAIPSHLQEFLWPDSYVRHAAAFVAVIGIASLVVRRPARGAGDAAPGERLRGPSPGDDA